MNEVRIKFVGFWDGWNSQNNFIINSLKSFCDPVISDNPDFLFSSCFSKDYLDYDCVRIFFTGENICPDFNLFDYAIGFEELNFGDRYLRYPLFLVNELYGEDYFKMSQKHLEPEQTLKEKTEFCSFVVSNGSELSDDRRVQFFKKLSEYKRVNSGGKLLNNIGLPEGVEDKLLFQSKHKFSICFENSSSPGYLTEKLIQGFAAKTIPIYFGDKNVDKYFDTRSFVNCHDYASFEEVIERVKEIDTNDDEYVRMLSIPAFFDKENMLEANEYQQYMNRELVAFLQRIVSQSPIEAIRTNRIRYGIEYLMEEKKKETSFRNSKRFLGRMVNRIYNSH